MYQTAGKSVLCGPSVDEGFPVYTCSKEDYNDSREKISVAQGKTFMIRRTNLLYSVVQKEQHSFRPQEKLGLVRYIKNWRPRNDEMDTSMVCIS